MSPRRERIVTEAETAVADVDAGEESQRYKLSIQVDIQNVGPCKSIVSRRRCLEPTSTHFSTEAISEVVKTATVPGFRCLGSSARFGEAAIPNRNCRFGTRQRVLMQSLEQLADENSLDPINEPDFDIESLVIPEEGDFEYEFDVEVRPEFTVPNYAGLKIDRPIREVTDSDVTAYLNRVITQYGTLIEQSGPAEPGDFVVASIEFSRDGGSYRKIPSVDLQLKPTIRFRDAEIAHFDELMAGATPGTIRTVDVVISE